MSNQHPLTDSFLQSYYKYGDGPYDEDQMRDVADRQLEQVIEWLKTNIEDYVLEDYYSTYFLPEAFFNDFKKAMRPTTQEENND